MKLGLREMLAAGPRAVGRYTGTLLTVFVVQMIVMLACVIAVSIVLAQAFNRLPMWDEAVDGDLVALIFCLRHGKAAFLATGGIVFAAILLWTIISWFLVGGINGVLAQRPEGRAETARAFGANGASTFLGYARLTLCSIPGWMLAFYLLAQGLDIADVKTRLIALTFWQAFGPIFLAILPAMIVLHILWTITDYARVELTLRQANEPSAVMTYVSSATYVLKRPRTLIHGAIGWLAFALITIGYVYLAQGHPMYGAGGAITLFVIRQGVALARTAIRFGVLAGQLELGKTRAAPPRRADVKDVKA